MTQIQGRITRLGSWLPIGGLIIAFGLRAIALNSRAIWYDEAFAILFSEKGFGAMLVGTLTPVQGAAADVHPIVYYTALSGWMQLVGESALAVRLLSVFTGLVAVTLVYAITRRLFRDRGTALVSLCIAGCLPFQVYYGQEARMYAPLAMFCAFVIWFYLRATTRITNDASSNHLWDWVGLSLSAAAAMYMHNLAAVFLLAFGLSTLTRPKVFAKVAGAGAGAFVLWLPWFINLPGQVAKLQQAYWVTKPNFVTLLQTLLIYHTGEELLETRWFLPVALFVSLVIPLMLAFQLFKGRKIPITKGAVWLAGLVVGTPAVLFLVSLYQPVYVQRVLLPADLLYAVVLGWFFWPPRGQATAAPWPIRALLAAGLGVVVGFGLVAHYTFANFPRPDFAAADSFLQQTLKPGDVVVHSNKLSYLPMYYYSRALPQNYVTDPLGSGSDTLALPTQQVLGLLAKPDVETAAQDTRHLWFVIFDKAIAEYAPAEHPHLAWLETHYTLTQTYHFNDLAVYEFNQP